MIRIWFKDVLVGGGKKKSKGCKDFITEDGFNAVENILKNGARWSIEKGKCIEVVPPSQILRIYFYNTAKNKKAVGDFPFLMTV